MFYNIRKRALASGISIIFLILVELKEKTQDFFKLKLKL